MGMAVVGSIKASLLILSFSLIPVHLGSKSLWFTSKPLVTPASLSHRFLTDTSALPMLSDSLLQPIYPFLPGPSLIN